jgi:hypothetical protein
LQNGFVLFVDHGFHRDSGGRERLGPEGKKHRLLLLIVVATPMNKRKLQCSSPSLSLSLRESELWWAASGS